MKAPASSLEMPDGWAERDAAWPRLDVRQCPLRVPGGSRAGRVAGTRPRPSSPPGGRRSVEQSDGVLPGSVT